MSSQWITVLEVAASVAGLLTAATELISRVVRSRSGSRRRVVVRGWLRRDMRREG
jgi:archaellum component FlaG (FlaF/FlaG flagellin family)